MTVRRNSPERALLVGVEFDRKGALTLAERMTELRELAVSAGAEVVGEIRQRRGRPDPATLIGPGKVEEVAAARQRLAADVVIFDHDLTPAQQRNLERAIGGKVIDRTQLILDIFAARARTREGQLQVELAQLQYLLPRLAGMGEALSRLGGGIGTRGPGETRLEVDRRRIRRRITELRRLLAEVRRHRATQRKRRERTGVPVVALVGYTNAGKTTLQRALVAAYGDPRHVPPVGRDRLFDTLDPTVRRVEWPGAGPVLVSDTVGFIHDLPHHLIAAFRATLEEVADADVLLHVVDVSQPRWPADMRAVDRVLAEIGADRQPRIVVFNKIDKLAPAAEPGDTAGTTRPAAAAGHEAARPGPNGRPQVGEQEGTGSEPSFEAGAAARAEGRTPPGGPDDTATTVGPDAGGRAGTSVAMSRPPGEGPARRDGMVPGEPPDYAGQRVPTVRVSALTGAGLDELAARVAEILRQRYRRVALAIPFARADVLARIHEAGRVVEERATPRGWMVVAELPLAEAGRLEREGWVSGGVATVAGVGEDGGRRDEW